MYDGIMPDGFSNVLYRSFSHLYELTCSLWYHIFVYTLLAAFGCVHMYVV